MRNTEGKRSDSEAGSEIENDGAHGCALAPSSGSLQIIHFEKKKKTIGLSLMFEIISVSFAEEKLWLIINA